MKTESRHADVAATSGGQESGRLREVLRRALLFVVLACGASLAGAATITVNTLSDELNADGDCSLREAIQAANTNAAVDACPAGGAGADLILLPAGTIPVAATIQVNESVTIRGVGRASTTVNRGGSTAFNSSAAGVVLTLEDMSVVGGANALNGAIVATRVDFSGDTINTSGGAITLTDVTLSGGSYVNTSSGAITMTNATMTGGGGVNTSSAAIMMTNVTMTGGGGVNTSSGAITLVDSSVIGSGNAGISSGGSVSLTRSLVSGSGEDGINVGGGTLTAVNSTISGNQGRGISAGVGSSVTLNAVTITGNTMGGLSSGAAVGTTAVHAILGPNGGPNCGAAVASSSYSIDSGITCALVGAGDRSITNPLLGALANNGGPTFTHLPQAGSPAIDNGSNGACQAVDQRGVARPADGDGDSTATCDIGAVEAGAGPPPPPPPPAAIETIPTLSEWGLMLLALLLGLVAARRMRSSTS